MNKDTYEGAWASDVMSGFGTTKYANGNVYSGEVRRLQVFASTSSLRTCVHDACTDVLEVQQNCTCGVLTWYMRPVHMCSTRPMLKMARGK